jgi:hypothetical protein
LDLVTTEALDTVKSTENGKWGFMPHLLLNALLLWVLAPEKMLLELVFAVPFLGTERVRAAREKQRKYTFHLVLA